MTIFDKTWFRLGKVTPLSASLDKRKDMILSKVNTFYMIIIESIPFLIFLHRL